MKIFGYIAFGIEVAGAVPVLITLFESPLPLTGADLLAAVQPALTGAQAAFGHAVPQALAVDITNSVADAINTYRKKPTPAAWIQSILETVGSLRIDVFHHFDDSTLTGKIDELSAQLTQLGKDLSTKMAALDDQITALTAAVTAETTANQSAITLINGFAAQLAAAVAAATAAGASPAQLAAIKALQDNITSNATSLAAAVAANTTPPPTPTPTPTPVP